MDRKYSAVTFGVQPVEQNGQVAGYVVSGYLTEKQLFGLRNLMDDSKNYTATKRWRGQYRELAQTIVAAVDGLIEEPLAEAPDEE